MLPARSQASVVDPADEEEIRVVDGQSGEARIAVVAEPLGAVRTSSESAGAIADGGDEVATDSTTAGGADRVGGESGIAVAKLVTGAVTGRPR